MEQKMINVSSLFLHMQHLSITITFLFFRLSKIKIFPNIVVHTKNATLEEALVL